jgi:hypothetical protein
MDFCSVAFPLGGILNSHSTLKSFSAFFTPALAISQKFDTLLVTNATFTGLLCTVGDVDALVDVPCLLHEDKESAKVAADSKTSRRFKFPFPPVQLMESL